jgi:hypothetical protein
MLSMICAETYGWGYYKYREATVYTDSLNESIENPGGKWTDFCDIERHSCFGLFCDVNQTLNEYWECVDSGIDLEFDASYQGYVYFHDDSPNYTITTKSQEYFKELKARMNRKDSSVYGKETGDYTDIDVYLQLFNFLPYIFESNTMLFLALANSSDVIMIDYRCSLIDTRFTVLDYLVDNGKFSQEQSDAISWVFTILSSVSLFLVAIFYACIRELRSNIIGKLVLVLAFGEAIEMIARNMDESDMVDFLEDVFVNANIVWFLALVYETFVLLKY